LSTLPKCKSLDIKDLSLPKMTSGALEERIRLRRHLGLTHGSPVKTSVSGRLNVAIVSAEGRAGWDTGVLSQEEPVGRTRVRAGEVIDKAKKGVSGTTAKL
jgi:hypothetical protein